MANPVSESITKNTETKVIQLQPSPLDASISILEYIRCDVNEAWQEFRHLIKEQ